MIRIQTTAIITALLLGFFATAEAQDEQKIVVHIGQYSNDLHAAAMGLSLAGVLLDEGADVTVFLDREGVRMVDSDQPALVFGDSDTGKLLDDFIVGGGKILLCPHCAMLAGVKAENLRDGVDMGTKATVAKLFLEADKVVDF